MKSCRRRWPWRGPAAQAVALLHGPWPPTRPAGPHVERLQVLWREGGAREPPSLHGHGPVDHACTGPHTPSGDCCIGMVAPRHELKLIFKIINTKPQSYLCLSRWLNIYSNNMDSSTYVTSGLYIISR